MERSRSLSSLIETLPDEGEGPLTFEMIACHFGRRSLGAMIFVLALPNIFPMPPGTSIVLGLPLLIVAPQLALGRPTLWAPGRLQRVVVDRQALAGVCKRAVKWVDRAEHLTKRRFTFMFGHAGDVVMGLVCTLLAFVLFLPIPLGNVLPALAVAVLALGLIQRDGLLAIAGYIMAAVSVMVLVLSGELLIQGIQRLGAMTGL